MFWRKGGGRDRTSMGSPPGLEEDATKNDISVVIKLDTDGKLHEQVVSMKVHQVDN